MFLEKYSTPGVLINLDYVIEINWLSETIIQFNTTHGIVTWEYDSEDEASFDINALNRWWITKKSGGLSKNSPLNSILKNIKTYYYEK